MQVSAAVSSRYHRARASLGLAVQAAIAAGIAWFISFHLLHHSMPFFAPISAVIVLAVSVGQRMRRATEVVLGNAFGILFGEVLVTVIGRGAWQVSLAVLIAILAAIVLGGSPALVGQSASSAVLVVTFAPGTQEYFFSRFVDAMVGGGVGLAVMALLLPLNPLTVVARACGPILDAIESGLIATAKALTERDAGEAQRALAALREAEPKLRAFADAITAGKEIAAFAPIRWGKRGALLQYVDAYDHIARTLRNSRVLTRRSISAISDDEPLPETLPAAVHALSAATARLRAELADAAEPEGTREDAIKAVRAGVEAYATGIGFSGSVIIAQIRSIASDLLQASGLSHDETAATLRTHRLRT
ncbi:uncharacterized membrane protein YgaE (UPF0421/DUF939 family) [Allocatelliglobosispora scoriae]|uniref:Uncharacterized membrane protein YgaE (UPF0421/DUF939 family) n=1 Tax=Allocatelliglobosispora scoriae TaxID=643052 RepID=A0A841BV75_9ACTN|nr:FUSC family protein [Allocatelliglobosispora scoriae]MBB5870651.1 uncharacterized membrane protein YgaE (UPF0421/DUF939 family) [Allocatelliglobosispora scoriae]